MVWRLFFIYFLLIGFSLPQENLDVVAIEETGLQKLIDNRNDKILLLNIWATWCAPCRKEIPDLIRIWNNYKSTVDVVGISIDYSEDLEKIVLPFLEKNNVPYINYISDFRKDENLINSLNKDWSGALPASFIYNPSGELIHFIEGKKDYDYFREMIENIETD